MTLTVCFGAGGDAGGGGGLVVTDGEDAPVAELAEQAQSKRPRPRQTPSVKRANTSDAGTSLPWIASRKRNTSGP